MHRCCQQERGQECSNSDKYCTKKINDKMDASYSCHSKDEPKMDDLYFNLLSLKHRDESSCAESLRW